MRDQYYTIEQNPRNGIGAAIAALTAGRFRYGKAVESALVDSMTTDRAVVVYGWPSGHVRAVAKTGVLLPREQW